MNIILHVFFTLINGCLEHILRHIVLIKHNGTVFAYKGNEQKKVTRKGTEKSTQKPWKIETTTKSSPDERVMIGSVVSMVVAPPMVMGASLPNHRASSGAQRRVSTSRMMLASRATVPSSAPLYSVMKILDRE